MGSAASAEVWAEVNHCVENTLHREEDVGDEREDEEPSWCHAVLWYSDPIDIHHFYNETNKVGNEATKQEPESLPASLLGQSGSFDLFLLWLEV